MDIYLDIRIHLTCATVESQREIDGIVYFKTGLLNEEINCLNCQKTIDEIHQIQYALIRDLPFLGRKIYLQVPRRQFNYRECDNF